MEEAVEGGEGPARTVEPTNDDDLSSQEEMVCHNTGIQENYNNKQETDLTEM